MKLLFVANVDWYVISHRIKIIEAAVNAGWDVTVACEDSGRKNEIEATGAKFINFPFERSGTNPIKELKLIKNFYFLYKDFPADVIHHVSLKPVIYGSLMAKLLKKPTVLNAVSGLGYVFTGENLKSALVQKAMLSFMKYGFKRDNLAFIFQNKDDHNELASLGSVYPQNKVYFIKGSGVDLKEYQPIEKEESDRVKILFPARMLYDKGIRELKIASEILKKQYQHKVQFVLAGMADLDNRAGVSEDFLNEWSNQSDYVNWIGYSNNMIQTFAESDIVALPSYREGLPKALIEAAAMGKPIVTCDTVGCRECVEDGVNGFLVPVKSGEHLAEALAKLINNPELRAEMGKASRQKAEQEFDVNQVIQKHLNIYQDLLLLLNNNQRAIVDQ